MKIRLWIIVAVCTAFVSGANANMLVNSGFEDDADHNGRPDEWTFDGVGYNGASSWRTYVEDHSSDAYSGDDYMDMGVSGGSGYSMVYQDSVEPAVAGAEYTLSAYAAGVTGTDGIVDFKLKFEFHDRTGQRIGQYQFPQTVPEDGDYYLRSASMTAPEEAVSVRGCVVVGGGNHILVDDVSLATERVRGTYVNGLDTIIGDAAAETQLLEFILDNGINYLAMYIPVADMQDAEWQNSLSDFIVAAKASPYNVQEIGAVGGGYNFQMYVDYNNTHAGQFEVINLEDEFWGKEQGSTERDEAFADYIAKLEDMNVLASANDLKVEAYIGWPTESELEQISDLLDRVLVHCYVTDPENAYEYGQDRLTWFNNFADTTEVIPLFSVAGSSDLYPFMGDWLQDNSPNYAGYDYSEGLDLAESIYLTDYYVEPSSPYSDIELTGFHYFTYSKQANVPPKAKIQTPSKQYIVLESPTSIDFTMLATDVNSNLQEVEWQDSVDGALGTVSVSGSSDTAVMTIDHSAPYTVVANAWDSGMFGNASLSSTTSEARWEVMAANQVPTQSRNAAVDETLLVTPGQSVTFLLDASDADGNLYGSEWYLSGNGYIGGASLTGESDTCERTITFETEGVYTVRAIAFDCSLYLPSETTRYGYADSAVTWTVTVDASGPGCSSYLPGDINMDCYVNLDDLWELLDTWMSCNDVANPDCSL